METHLMLAYKNFNMFTTVVLISTETNILLQL